jgi:hypothetical protein
MLFTKLETVTYCDHCDHFCDQFIAGYMLTYYEINEYFYLGGDNPSRLNWSLCIHSLCGDTWQANSETGLCGWFCFSNIDYLFNL